MNAKDLQWFLSRMIGPGTLASNRVVFIVANNGSSPFLMSLGDMRYWYRENDGSRLRRFMANGGVIKRVK